MSKLTSKSWLLLACVIACLPAAAQGTTRIVPDNHPSIQTAINASLSGDTVIVRPGTYFENIKIVSKSVVLKSISGPSVTTIDGSQPHHPDSASVVHLFGAGTSGRLEGFTIRGGRGSASLTSLIGRRGGGVLIEAGTGQGPVIEGNWIMNNTVGGNALPKEGGGVCAYGPARILRNRIAFNSLSGYGGGLYYSDYMSGATTRLVIENEIYGNMSALVGGYGDGGGGFIGRDVNFSGNIVALNQSETRGGGLRIGSGVPPPQPFEGNTIFGNYADNGVGGIWLNVNMVLPSIALLNNLIANNINGGIECHDFGGDIVLECNDVVGNDPDIIGDCGIVLGQGTNFQADPLFGRVHVPYTPGDLCVLPDSPVLPENSPPGCGLVGALGQCTFVGIKEAQEVVRTFHTGAPYPNPASGTTLIPISVDRSMPVEVTVYTIAGRTVRHLDGGSFIQGSHNLEWDGRDASGDMVPPGVYVAQVRAGNQQTARVIVRTR